MSQKDTDRSSSQPAEARHFAAGRFRLCVEPRAFGGDGGLAFRLYGPLAGAERELLRFDCFDKRPHYHVGLSVPQARIFPIEAEDSVRWSLAQLRTRLLDMLAQVGADTPSGEELASIQAGVSAVEADL